MDFAVCIAPDLIRSVLYMTNCGVLSLYRVWEGAISEKGALTPTVHKYSDSPTPSNAKTAAFFPFVISTRFPFVHLSPFSIIIFFTLAGGSYPFNVAPPMLPSARSLPLNMLAARLQEALNMLAARLQEGLTLLSVTVSF